MKWFVVIVGIGIAGLFSFSQHLSIGYPSYVLGTQEEDSQNQEAARSPLPRYNSAILAIGERVYELQAPQGSTAYEVMKIAQETQGLSFQGKEFSGMGFFVEEINGLRQTNDMVWIYSINGQKAQVGISQYKVQDGDTISWSYEKLR